ncbi:MAG: chemotaxis protein CheD [Fibrobacterota bacterium]
MNGITIVGIADMKTANSGGKLVTYALGSCIGVSFYSPESKTGALLHYMLPNSKLSAEKAEAKPFMFADSGIYSTLVELQKIGVKKKGLIVKVAGGSNILDAGARFNIGKRNYLALKKILWKYNLMIKAEDVGLSLSRNMTLDLNSGAVNIRYSGNPQEKIL